MAICYDPPFPGVRAGAGVERKPIWSWSLRLEQWLNGLPVSSEAELQVAAFQNGYFAALANRVGEEEGLTFCRRILCGRSFRPRDRTGPRR